MLQRLGAAALALAAFAGAATAPHASAFRAQHGAPGTVQFAFTSDAHYGLTRPTFRGRANVSAHDVNAALVAAMNALPSTTFPDDEGVGAGAEVGAIDFVAEGGDVANREEIVDGVAIQPASVSWRQFVADYVDGLSLTGRSGQRTPLFVVPGNHDASDAIGFWKPMTPRTDASAMVGIFNLMMRPAVARTAATYRYDADRVLTSRDIGGIHFVFLQVWPDSRARRWMESDLARVDPDTPVVIVTHDQPDVEAKHLLNPNGVHDLNDHDRFENLLADVFADGPTIDGATIVEQRALEQFLAAHPNVAAYFHGNSNWNEFYEWTGPSHAVRLHTFRVDSPMKGRE